MHKRLGPLAAFFTASTLSLGTLLVLGAVGPEPRPLEASASTRAGHALSRMVVVREVLDKVEEEYVEPARVDPDRMFTAALDATERLVPEVLFRRDGTRVVAVVGPSRTVVDVGDVHDLRSLREALQAVGSVLERHLDPADVPGRGADLDPMARIEIEMANGMLATLDPHSQLLPPEQSHDMDVENRGEFGGLGIDIEMQDDRLVVIDARPGNPAAVAGVRPGDHIRRIDGQSTINLSIDEAVELLRGPVDAPVTLEVVHEGGHAAQDVVVTRARIKINEVEGATLPGGMGYVRIPSFHIGVHRDLAAELKRLARESDGLKGLVLDLRDNPGGYLSQAVAVADTFLDDGLEIVSTRGPYRRDAASVELARANGTEDPYPIVVLHNGSSASASEIVAGALRNNQRAVIVGERTFGKGSVQNLHALPLDSKLKLTIAHYLTPGDRSIQSVGIPADIELTPAFVGMGADGQPEVSLFSRERLRREVDLVDHLERADVTVEEPTYRVRHLQDPDAMRPSYGPPVLASDPELAFALELLQVAPRAHRGDMLVAAGPLVRRRAAQEDTRIVTAFAELGVDWADGPVPAQPALSVSLSLGDDEVLRPGRLQPVTLTVTNDGPEPVHRVAAVATDHDALEGAEFFFGRLAPGASASWTQPVRLPEGWPSEVADVTLVLRAGTDEVEVGRHTAPVEVQGLPDPHLAWSWRVLPDRDGTISVGDLVHVELAVVNDGEGPSFGATGRIRNRSGRALDVRTGTIRAGRMVDDAGRACAPTAPGWEAGEVAGDPASDLARVRDHLPPVWPEDCRRVLAAGERWTGRFEVVVAEPLDSGYRLDLSVEDDVSYDYAAYARGVLGDDLAHEDVVRFGLGVPTGHEERRAAPAVAVTRSPPLDMDGDLATLSGLATDPDGLDHVVIWVDGDKVFVESGEGSERVEALPFSTEVRLDPGLHTLTVLARDALGHTTATSRVVRRSDPGWQVQASRSR